MLCLMELTFDKVVKSRNFSAVLSMHIHTSLSSVCIAIAGLFTSGEWRSLKGETQGFKKGVSTVICSSLAWQGTSVGLVRVVFEVDSLLSNVISTLGIPIARVFAVVLFGNRMDGLKVISLLSALWGFVSYFCQHYVDDNSEEKKEKGGDEVCGA